jgi:hypothetical protein
LNRYFFNFRQGEEVSRDALGMYLSGLDEAREEAMLTCRDLIMVAEQTGESPDCELQVADASGEPVLVIPCGQTKH